MTQSRPSEALKACRLEKKFTKQTRQGFVYLLKASGESISAILTFQWQQQQRS